MKAIARVVAKDLRAELRTKEVVTSTVFFGLIVLLVFNFGFNPGTRDLRVVGAGILWISFLFSALLAMNRLMLNELRSGGLEGLMLCPLPRTSLYLAKCTTLFVVLSISEAATLALFVLFFNADLAVLPGLVAVVAAGTLGLVAVGTTFATMSVRSRAREVLLPLLLVPVAVPLLIAAVETTTVLLAAPNDPLPLHWLRLLVAFDVLFLGLGYLTYPALLEE